MDKEDGGGSYFPKDAQGRSLCRVKTEQGADGSEALNLTECSGSRVHTEGLRP